MKKILIILTAALFITLTAKGQNLFFIGENSYPCTETFRLQAKISSPFGPDYLNVLFAKDGTTALFVVSKRNTAGVLFSEKLIIYLDDGAVITCIDREKSDYVDNIASAVYYLTNEQLSKMKNSNINTVRFSLKCGNCYLSDEEGDFTASNKGSSKFDFPAIVSDFFEEGEITERIRLEEDGRSQEGTGLGNYGVSYSLAGRTPQTLPLPQANFKQEGIVVVEVTIDRNGNVTKATPGVKGSTTLSEKLLKAAKDAALAAKFDGSPNSPAFQKGTITYHFILR